VTAFVRTGNTIYVGGYFTQIYPNTGSASVLDAARGLPSTPFPRTNGVVYAAVPDGSGGWFMGGTFTTVGSVTRNRLAHILADGTVSYWNPNANGEVDCIALSGSTVYVGGVFTFVGNQTRNHIAALGAATGLATTWDPNANNAVYCMTLSGATLYVGGAFNFV